MSFIRGLTINTVNEFQPDRKAEKVLYDLRKAMPYLKPHAFDVPVREKIKAIRSARKKSKMLLKVSRTWGGKLIEKSITYTNNQDKYKFIRDMSTQVRAEIKKIRAENKPPIESYRFPNYDVRVNKLGECYLEPGTFIKVLNKKIRADLFKSKAPTTNDNYIGVEIEIASITTQEVIADKLLEAGVGKYVCIKTDGSIQAEGNYVHKIEIAICVRQNEYKEVIRKIMDVLNRQCKVKVNKSCGLHVHVDMRNRNVEKAFSNLVSMQHYLYGMVPVARKGSQYSIPVNGKKWRVTESRYHGINSQAYQKYRTLENRIHSGTTDANKILGWIDLNLAIVDAPEIKRSPSTIKGLQKATNMSNDLLEYVEGRLNKFKNQHAGLPSNGDSFDESSERV